jgi:hypothetical protein
MGPYFSSAASLYRGFMESAERRATYMALAELAARWASKEDPFRGPGRSWDLTPYELRVFSQNGEDGVIAEVLRRVGVGSRRFVEFGAEDGLEGNCAFLADVLGWEGLFIEASSERFDRLSAKFRDRSWVRTRRASVSPDNINSLISEAGLDGEIDVLSIDIDGHDYWVWDAIEVVVPRLVVIEYNAHIPYPVRLTQPLTETAEWAGTDYFGASLAALEHCGAAKGYVLVHTDVAGVNAFFVRIQDAQRFPPHERVPKRAPNFFLTGRGHLADDRGRLMVDPDPSAP